MLQRIAALFRHTFLPITRKVKEQGGTPKVVYRGSPNEFSEFSYQFMRTNGTTEGVGFYFTDNQSIVKGYGDKGDTGKLYEVYLNISKPLNIDSKASILRAILVQTRFF